jgi:hypothetical protein
LREVLSADPFDSDAGFWFDLVQKFPNVGDRSGRSVGPVFVFAIVDWAYEHDRVRGVESVVDDGPRHATRIEADREDERRHVATHSS